MKHIPLVLLACLLAFASAAFAAPSVTTPANGGNYVSAPTLASGDVGAPAGDSATRVLVLLFRYGTNAVPRGYWNGSGWTTGYSGVANLRPAQFGGTTWRYALPTPAQGLLAGRYAIAVKASYSQHPGASSPYSLFSVLAPDATSPSVAFTRPLNGAILNTLDSLTGTAGDKAGSPYEVESGVTSVQVEMMRTSDRLWWTGTTWGARTLLLAQWNADGTWKLDTNLPAGAALTDGLYSINALATDKARLRSRVAIAIRIDTHAPTVAILTPHTDVQVATLKPISGTAIDDVRVQSVQISIERQSDGLWWTGTAWGARTLLPTVLTSDGTWNRPVGYPLGSDLQKGFYSITAIATDAASNAGQGILNLYLNPSLPTISITVPKDGATFNTPDLGTISGKALDNPGGEGMSYVTVEVQRLADGTFWNGTGWDKYSTPLPTNLQVNGSWSKSTGLPSGATLQSGRYLLTATANDKAGNHAKASVGVTVQYPSAGRIVFASKRDGNYEIYSMNPDGSGQTRLTNNPAIDFDSVLSRDGRKIAFFSDRNPSGIYVMNVDGSGLIQVPNTSYDDRPSSFSPDGQKILFERADSSGNYNYDIFVINVDGTGVAQLTNDPNNDETPSWSPNGTKIAFVARRDGHGEIYVMNPDGSGQARLTKTPDTYESLSPTWTPDSRRIVYASGDFIGARRFTPRADPLQSKVDIYIMNADGSNPTRLTNDPATDNLAPSVSPDGRKIAFQLGRTAESSPEHYYEDQQIYAMNIDGTGQAQLTSTGTENSAPSWGEDVGDYAPPRVGFTTLNNGAVITGSDFPAIAGTAFDNDGGTGVQSVRLEITRSVDNLAWTGTGWGGLTLLSTDFQGREGTWSKSDGLPTDADLPNGDYEILVIATDKAGNQTVASIGIKVQRPLNGSLNGKLAFTTSGYDSGIFVINADGTNQTLLTAPNQSDAYPSFNRDGSRIAFESRRDGNREIYIMNADGSGQTRLTTNPVADSQPSLSPDGTRITFVSERDGNLAQIYVMNADGTNQQRLTALADGGEEPAFSPDGNRILFTSQRDGNREIYVMNADGSGQSRLTHTTQDEITPSWSPNGIQIAFGRIYEYSNDQIYVMNADGSYEVRLPGYGNSNDQPIFSPDGSKIVYHEIIRESHSGSDFTLLMNADGTSAQTLKSYCLVTTWAPGHVPPPS